MTPLRARRILAIIDRVETRCLAADGRVTPTSQEISELEWRQLGFGRRPSEKALRRIHQAATAYLRGADPRDRG